MRNKKSSFQKFRLKISITGQSETKVRQLRLYMTSDFVWDSVTSGQTTEGKIELIKAGKGAIRKLYIYIYIYIYIFEQSKHIIPIIVIIDSFPETGGFL
jgi:hypothetical protein